MVITTCVNGRTPVTHFEHWPRNKEKLPIIGLYNNYLVCYANVRKGGKAARKIYLVCGKVTSLPHMVTLPLCQTEMVINMAISTYSPEEEGCVVAVKLLGPQLSFYRPSNSEWINVQIEHPSFFFSGVMFSRKDEMFHIVGSGGHLMGSWDLHQHTSKFRNLRFHNLLEISKTKRELLVSCCTSEHLVESPTTDETFMVKWYRKTSEAIMGIDSMETKGLMVFKLEKDRNAVYTQNIGDLVIYLTNFETLCVPASSVPDLCPNNVMIWDVDESTIVYLAGQDWDC